MAKSITVRAPGKLILSGEHAVVYGAPALAMAVNRYVTATLTESPSAKIAFDLADLAHRSALTLDALGQFKERIKRKYKKFIRGEYRISAVLQKPFELAQFAMSMFSETFHLTLPRGVKLKLQSDIPIGCGMGSSAATILSVMTAVAQYSDLSICSEKLFQLALQVENMQHGRSSGLDLRVAQRGGCLFLHGEQIESRAVPTIPMYLINTGIPKTSTGQCVEAAAIHFQSSAELKQDFENVTCALDESMKDNNLKSVQDAIRANHQLLQQIGVVPERVAHFIKSIEEAQGAAKICGAGAIKGDQAGAVLVMIEDASALSMLCTSFGFTSIPVMIETRGVHVV